MKTLSIVIPVYNEEERLGKTLKALSELQVPRGLKLEKVIFVDDGSDDKTKSKIKNQKSKIERQLNTKVEIVSYKENKGKGYAVAKGMEASNSEHTLFCDADMSTPLVEVTNFVPHIKRNVPIIVGTRKNGESTVITHQPLYRELLGRGFTFLSNMVLNTRISDFTCGFKAFSKEAKDAIFPRLQITRWGFDAEVLFLAKKFGLKVIEVPVVWQNDTRSKVSLWRDLPASFIELLLVKLYHARGLYQKGEPKVKLQPAYSLMETIKTMLF